MKTKYGKAQTFPLPLPFRDNIMSKAQNFLQSLSIAKRGNKSLCFAHFFVPHHLIVRLPLTINKISDLICFQNKLTAQISKVRERLSFCRNATIRSQLFLCGCDIR